MAKLWLCFLLVALSAVLSNAQNQELEQKLDPVQQSVLSNEAVEGDIERGDREKRLGILKKIGLKAGLLDFVFGKIDSFIDSKTRYIDELDKQNIYKNEKYYGITYPPKTNPHNNLKPVYLPVPVSTTTTGRPPVNFELNAPVSLSIPDGLYGNSITLLTNASRILTDVIYNTADRAQELADVVNSKLQNKFYFAKKLIKFTHPVWKISGPNHGDASTGSSASSSSASSSSSSSSSSSDSSSNSVNLLTKRHVDSSTS